MSDIQYPLLTVFGDLLVCGLLLTRRVWNWTVIISAKLVANVLLLLMWISDPWRREKPWSSGSFDSCIPLQQRDSTKPNGMKLIVISSFPKLLPAIWLLWLPKAFVYDPFIICCLFNSKYKILENLFSWSLMKVRPWLMWKFAYRRNFKFQMRSSPR